VVVLTTGHTTTTRALAVLADTTVTGGHVAAAMRERIVSIFLSSCIYPGRCKAREKGAVRCAGDVEIHRKFCCRTQVFGEWRGGSRLTASACSKNG
jgi:hypothetical protein